MISEETRIYRRHVGSVLARRPIRYRLKFSQGTPPRLHIRSLNKSRSSRHCGCSP